MEPCRTLASDGPFSSHDCPYVLHPLGRRAFSVAQLCLTLHDPVGCTPAGSSVHGIFPGKSTGVSCHFLLQGIFPTLRSLTHISCIGRQILYPSATWEALVHQDRERDLGSGEVTMIPPQLTVERSSELGDTVQHLERSCASPGEYGQIQGVMGTGILGLSLSLMSREPGRGRCGHTPGWRIFRPWANCDSVGGPTAHAFVSRAARSSLPCSISEFCSPMGMTASYIHPSSIHPCIHPSFHPFIHPRFH